MRRCFRRAGQLFPTLTHLGGTRWFGSAASLVQNERAMLLTGKLDDLVIVQEGEIEDVPTIPVPYVRGRRVTMVETVDRARHAVGILEGLPVSSIVAWNVEATDIDPKRFHTAGTGCRVLCLSCVAEGADFGEGSDTLFIDVLQSCEENSLEILNEFKPYLENPDYKKCSHSSVDDFHVLMQQGITLRGMEADTRYLSRVANTALGSWEGGASAEEEGRSNSSKGGNYDLKACAESFGCLPMEEYENGYNEKMERFILKLNGSKIAHFSSSKRAYWIWRTVEKACITKDLLNCLTKKLKMTKWISEVFVTPEGDEERTMYDLANLVHRPLLQVLAQVELNGMTLDLNFLESVRVKTKNIVKENENNFLKFCAEMRDPRDPTRFLNPDADMINVNSALHVRHLLFGYPSEKQSEWFQYGKSLKIPNQQDFEEEAEGKRFTIAGIGLRAIKSKMNKKRLSDYSNKGLPSVNLKLLTEFAGKDPDNNVFGRAAEQDQLGKFGTEYVKQACLMLHSMVNITKYQYVLSSFIDPLIEKTVYSKIHPSLSLDTSTGRLACRKPNLHNPPNASDTLGVRAAFTACGDENSLIVADYSQLELRILAHVTNCASMIASLNAGGDYHSRTAMDMFPHVRECPVGEVKHKFPAERSKAKAVNFSIAYGKSARSIAEDMDCELKEAEELLTRWYSSKPEVGQWKAETIFKAQVTKKVESILGRTRDIPHIDKKMWKGRSERAAVNHCIQGSAADIAICAMVQIGQSPRLKELGFKLLMQIHDEFIIEGPTVHAEEAKCILVDLMQNPFRTLNPDYVFKVPLEVDAGVGPNWLVAKP